jgi:hypothetical protein
MGREVRVDPCEHLVEQIDPAMHVANRVNANSLGQMRWASLSSRW